MLNLFKKWASPIAIIMGILCYRILDHLSFLIPAMLFLMIFITYCSLSLREVKFHRMHFVLISTQIVMGLFVYFLIKKFSSLTAEAMMICIMAPTAISATVIAAMIGGNIASLTLYTLLGNLVTALILPFLLPSLGISVNLPYFQSFIFILKQLFLMLIALLIGTIVLSRFFSNAYNAIWIAQSYLQPLASIAPTAYILWQATFNGYQVWRYQLIHPEGRTVHLKDDQHEKY